MPATTWEPITFAELAKRHEVKVEEAPRMTKRVFDSSDLDAQEEAKAMRRAFTSHRSRWRRK